jgi:hypothetical protein
MTPIERDIDQEDFEARKDDTRIQGRFPGSATLGADEEEAPN